MNFKHPLRALTTSLVGASLLLAQQVLANDAPRVAIDGITDGALVFNGPVQISGSARDSDGIRVIYGTIQNNANKLFLTPNGKYSKDPTRLPFKFAKNVDRTTWATNPYRLPAGEYMFRMRVEDGKKLRTEKIEIPLRVGAVAQVARPAATSADTKRPVVPAKQTASAPQPATKPAKTLAANGMPYCSNPGMDADKDGYGWENEKSCIVAGSRADKHPNCASATSDPDGDGWGWENEASCIVVAHCKSAGSDPDGDGWGWENNKSCVVVKTAGKHPPCASAKSDPDGDGYGWENNATCLVAN